MKIRQTVELLIGQPNRRTDGRTDGRTHGWTDGRTDVCGSHIRRTFLLCEELLKSITNDLCALKSMLRCRVLIV